MTKTKPVCPKCSKSIVDLDSGECMNCGALVIQPWPVRALIRSYARATEVYSDDELEAFINEVNEKKQSIK